MRKTPRTFLFILAIAVAGFHRIHAAVPGGTLDGKTREERAQGMARYVAGVRPPAKDEKTPKHAAPFYAARLYLGVDTEYALQKLAEAANYQVAKGRDRLARSQAYHAAADKSKIARPGPALDPFDKFALMNTYLLGKDKIPAATARKIRDYVALYDDHKALTGYAKGAWNYRLMLDSSGYLAAQEWPELVDRAGLDAKAIQAATGRRLFDGFREITRQNFGEYGAGIYLAVNLSAVHMLAVFAKDEEMRRRAALTLDAMMLDVACTWNQGYNAGSASRAKYWYSTDTGPSSMASTAAVAWIYFGAHRPVSAAGLGVAHSFWMAVPNDYAPSEAIVRVATERARPFVHRSHVARMGSANVHRMTYHTPSYSLCSQWDQPDSATSGLYKESRRHMLKWLSDKPSSTFAVCMENPYRPYNPAQRKANTLGYGENAFSRYFQHKGTLLGLYSVPDQLKHRNRVFPYPYHKLYAPFPATGSILKRFEKDGWVFCHNGGMLMAFRCLKPWKWGKRWGNHDVLWCDARKNGWILETTELKPFAGGGVDAELGRFAKAVLDKTRIDASGLDADPPVLRYLNLQGVRMDFRWPAHGEPYKDHLKVDGKTVPFDRERLIDNPWVRQKTNSPELVLEIDGKRTIYDFERWTRQVQRL